MVRSSPRARAGFSRLAASPCPAAPPAPISVCASSMNRMIGFGTGLDFVDHRLQPVLELALDAGAGLQQAQIERAQRRRCCSAGGTSPAAMRRANPSTTAVLPTPASPVRIGLFWRRRVRMSIIWRISVSRPRTGSILPARACAVRSMVNWSSAADPPGRAAAAAARTPPAAPIRPAPAASAASAAVGGDRSEVALQDVGLDAGELAGCLARAPRQRLVGQQRPQQMAGADPARALLDRGEQPGLLDHVDDIGRQRRARARCRFSSGRARG